jgi:hypothetical protein
MEAMKTKLYLDFEYIESQDRTEQLTICCSVLIDNGTRQTNKFYDLRSDTQKAYFIQEITKFDDAIFIAYNVIAEITSLLRIGVSKDFIRKVEWIDLWTESKMFILTHPDYYSAETGLKNGALKVFNIPYPFDMRLDPIKILLEGKGNYTDTQWEQIQKYNRADVQVLPLLLEKLKQLWNRYGVMYNEVQFRSQFCVESAIQYTESKGFPMDVDMIKDVFNNRELIKYHVGMECNEVTGHKIYVAKVKKRPHELSFSLEGFSTYLRDKGLFQVWDKTSEEGDTNKNGKLKKVSVSTQKEVFEKFLMLDEFLSSNKDTLQNIYYARNTIKQLNSTNLADLLTSDGYIRTPPFPYNQKSGRSSPKPKLGFILNLVPWIRMCVKPKPGKAFIAADWSQQEIALAGFFSQDKKLLESYKGDHYITNAIACGFAPEGATKASHPVERDLMKPTSLGIIYGMGIKSMAMRVEAAMGWVHDKDKIEMEMWEVKDGEFTKYYKPVSRRAYEAADKFITGHKAYYTTYWSYVQQHAKESLLKGFYKVPLNGWYYFVEKNHQATQLQNIPNQAGGAAVMQQGFINASLAGLSIVCSLHDALYVECDLDKVEETKQALLKAMADSVATLTNGTVQIRNEVKVFTENEPFTDPRGTKTYNLVKDLLKKENI